MVKIFITKQKILFGLDLLYNEKYLGKPPIIAMLYGRSKPQSTKEYLNNFVIEANVND